MYKLLTENKRYLISILLGVAISFIAILIGFSYSTANALGEYSIESCYREYGTVESCSDIDKDGLSGIDDLCPNTISVQNVNEYGCEDSDNDGYYDESITYEMLEYIPEQGISYGLNGEKTRTPFIAYDECPGESGTAKGCPDSDDDGIPDKNDKCPQDPSSSAIDGCTLTEEESFINVDFFIPQGTLGKFNYEEAQLKLSSDYSHGVINFPYEIVNYTEAESVQTQSGTFDKVSLKLSVYFNERYSSYYTYYTEDISSFLAIDSAGIFNIPTAEDDYRISLYYLTDFDNDGSPESDFPGDRINTYKLGAYYEDRDLGDNNVGIYADLCPNTAGGVITHGCPDTDGDGFPDIETEVKEDDFSFEIYDKNTDYIDDYYDLYLYKPKHFIKDSCVDEYAPDTSNGCLGVYDVKFSLTINGNVTNNEYLEDYFSTMDYTIENTETGESIDVTLDRVDDGTSAIHYKYPLAEGLYNFNIKLKPGYVAVYSTRDESHIIDNGLLGENEVFFFIAKDSDGDGLADESVIYSTKEDGTPYDDNNRYRYIQDLCENEPGPIESGGCPDSDNDGYPDIKPTNLDVIYDYYYYSDMSEVDSDEFNSGLNVITSMTDGTKRSIFVPDECPTLPSSSDDFGCPDVKLELESESVDIVKDSFVDLSSYIKEASYKNDDNLNIDISDMVEIEGDVDTSKVGDYSATYKLELSDSNTITRTLKIGVVRDLNQEVTGVTPELDHNAYNLNIIVQYFGYSDFNSRGLEEHLNGIMFNVQNTDTLVTSTIAPEELEPEYPGEPGVLRIKLPEGNYKIKIILPEGNIARAGSLVENIKISGSPDDNESVEQIRFEVAKDSDGDSIPDNTYSLKLNEYGALIINEDGTHDSIFPDLCPDKSGSLETGGCPDFDNDTYPDLQSPIREDILNYYHINFSEVDSDTFNQSLEMVSLFSNTSRNMFIDDKCISLPSIDSKEGCPELYLELNKYNDTFNNIENINFENYIKEAYYIRDGEKVDLKEYISISSTVDGENNNYKVTYRLSVEGSDVVEKTLLLEKYIDIKPVINISKPYDVIALGSDIDINSYLIEAYDIVNGKKVDISNNITTSSDLDTNKTGYYFITYKVSDADGNEASDIVSIRVVRDILNLDNLETLTPEVDTVEPETPDRDIEDLETLTPEVDTVEPTEPEVPDRNTENLETLTPEVDTVEEETQIEVEVDDEKYNSKDELAKTGQSSESIVIAIITSIFIFILVGINIVYEYKEIKNKRD